MIDVNELYGKAVVHQAKKEYSSAINLLNTILSFQPSYAPAWNVRGICLNALGHPFDAIMNFDKAFNLIKGSDEEANRFRAIVLTNRGNAYMNMESFEKSLFEYERASYANPKLPEPLTNRGNVYRRMGKNEEALKEYRAAIKADPRYADAHLGVGMCLLQKGEFEEGWAEFESRWHVGQMNPRGLKYPEWNGDKCDDPAEALLIYAEQGMGDTLQFCRYAQMAKEQWGGKVYLEVQAPTVRIIQSMPGPDLVFPFGDRIPSEVTNCIPMMSVPRVVKATLENIPFVDKYFFADVYRTSIFAEEIAQFVNSGHLGKDLRVGLCWAGGNRQHDPRLDQIDRARSMSLADFSPLASLPGICWVSLQKGPPKEQVKNPPVGMFIADWSEDLYDFYDTAALIANLDLVITVDTAVAHLAAGLGKPTWMLSRFDGCWRWMGDRPNSVWYSSLRQYRQKELHQWEPVIQSVKQDLTKLLIKQRKAA